MVDEDHVVCNLKGVGKAKGAMFDGQLGGKAYLWIGDSTLGCYIAVDDLRTLRRMRDVLDAVIAKRERRAEQTGGDVNDEHS